MHLACWVGLHNNEWPTEKVKTTLPNTVDVYKRQVTLDDKEIAFTIIDGESSFCPVTVPRFIDRMLSRNGPAGVIFVYDSTNYDSWKKVIQDAIEQGKDIEQRNRFPPGSVE